MIPYCSCIYDISNNNYIVKYGLDCVVEILDVLCTKQYDGYTIYCHNFSKFDFNLIFKDILKYKYNFISRDDNLDVLFLTLSYPLYNKSGVLLSTPGKIKFLDSYKILNKSLDKLAKSFKLENTKGSI